METTRTLAVLAMLMLALFVCPGVCEEENTPAAAAEAAEILVPTATPAPVMLVEPTPTPEWLTVIQTEVYLARHDYAEEIGYELTHLLPMPYLTTHMAALMTEYDDVCEVSAEVEYSTSRLLEFEMKVKVTAPDGTVMENCEMRRPMYSGTDEDEYTHEEQATRDLFAKMMEENGAVTPGLYLVEIFFDGQLIGSHNFTVLECDYSLGFLDHDTRLYASPECTEVLAECPMGDDVKILDIKPSGEAYLGFVFEVEWNDRIGYIKCYNVMPVCDEQLLRAVASENMDGLSVEYISSNLTVGNNYSGWEIVCMTRGQAAYCAEMEEATLKTSISYKMKRAFIPKGLGSAVAHITYPNKKSGSIELEDAFAQTVEDSAKMVFDHMDGKKRTGSYGVSIEIGGETYAEYSVDYWGENFNVTDGRSSSLDISIYTRVIRPDKTVYESTVDEQTWNYFSEDMYNSYDDLSLERVFAQMMEEGGIQTGIYTVQVFIDNAMMYASEFEVLDEELVVAQVSEPTSLYESKSCQKELRSVSGGTVITLEEGTAARFKTRSRYGDWMEEHTALPAKYKDDVGYVDSEYVRMLTDESLPEYIQQMLTTKERPDWMSLSISPASTSSDYTSGSASEEIMTIGTASLAAEHKAYKIRTYVYYSLKEDRKAQFQIKITRPDGVVYERKKTAEPNYNLENKSLYSDYSICDMLKEMKKEEGILPGAYHYEIWETVSGMYMDGWFELLDVELALGKTIEDAKIYASPNKSRVIAEAPIYSDLFLYDDYRCKYSGYSSVYNDTSGDYIARVSWNGIMGYMEQQDYSVEAQEGAELQERLGDETVDIHSLNLIYTEQKDSGLIDSPLELPLEYDQISRMLGSYGDVSVRAEMTYSSPETAQLMLFSFVVEAPSGRQMAMSEMYVNFDKPGRDSSENVLVDAGSIVTLLERMGTQGMVEEGIYQYRVMMNGQVLAQTQFEVADQGKFDAYYSTPWASEDDEEEAVSLEPQETEAGGEQAQSGAYGMVKIRESGNVNVRKESNADSSRVGSAKAGAEYPCLGIAENGWYQIQLDDGVIGYVSNKMASLIEN